MIIIALAIFVLTLVLFSIETVLVLAIATLLFVFLCRSAQARLEGRVALVDFALQVNEDPGRVISDRNHPLWSIGRLRGPDA